MNFNVPQPAKVMFGETVCVLNTPVPASGEIGKPLRRFDRNEWEREMSLRLEERQKERTRVARELHDTLLQGCFGASLLLHTAAEQIPADSPGKLSVSRALHMIQRVLEDARVTLHGLRSSTPAPASLEQALSSVRDEFTPDRYVEFRVFVTGQLKPLQPDIQEQISLIGREALINALRHSRATKVEAEIEYLPRRLRLLVRDNGCGIDPGLLRAARNLHWGLVGMRERAANIGAKLRIWSRPGTGTEVEISVPNDVAAHPPA